MIVNKRFQVWLPLLFSLVMIIGILLGYQLNGAMGKRQNTTRSMNGTASEVLELINQKYVDKVDLDSLNFDAVQAILNRLDPHTVYIPPVRLADVNNDLRGSFKGVGIEYQIFNDTLNVLYVVDDGPAAKAGVQIGDQIIKVGDTLIAGRKLKNDDYRRLLRGEGGAEVTLSMLRNNASLKANVKRGIVPIPSLDAAYMAAPGVGYIRLNKFAETTYIEFMKAMDKLKPLGMKTLMLDLRGNGGGVLQAAVNIADEFLEDDEMIVYTEGTHVKKEVFRSNKEGVFEKGKLIVLMDEGSASASEVLAGALQDHDRCTIVGRRSFGKGLVQNQFALTDGGALRLTVARYFTPLGRSIQKSYKMGRKAYGSEVADRFEHPDSLYNDSVYTKGKAFKTPKGKILYDGGGITPDVYVPFDTVHYTEGVNKLLLGNTLSSFTYQYYKQNKAAVTAYKNPDGFEKGFVVPAGTWESLMGYATKDSIDLSTTTEQIKAEVLLRFKSLLARQLYRNDGYFEVQNADDDTYKKAVEVSLKP